ncbi:DUF803-domain-containing protein [Pleurostoma richardsiae]|uniref:DUF803-domain-containing protein n=1 Tax=Pleurostoma richardsiae TaxID=41990 RepID=A0AA38S562_9PEZI|nr:DUF803-domain-containing protein [Pleurostoma richardsiae]
MEHATQMLSATAHELYARANTTSTDPDTQSRPSVYKAIGISLAVGSGAFIGTSFVLKKVGLLKANEKYNEVAGEGYGYLKNAYWWSGMTLMILGEILNFVAYAFTDAILVTPLGALSVVITTVFSAIFLKERLSMVGKVACFLCIVGSVVIVMNAPQESSVATIQEMQHFVIAPGFLSYAGVIILGSVVTAFYFGPRYGKKNMLVYLSICSWVGGLSVVATQGLGAAIVAQVGGTAQFNQWFLYVLLVFVIGTLLTEIIFLNKALNLFNAAMVTPTYYVYFTSTTIITSAVLFRGFKGTATSIVTVVMGFLVICSGVVLLQLSKSAKDVPDAAVFAGDLDQIHTIAEQEQPETEPKADAIRGAAALVRRFSVARQKMEIDELKRLHEEKERERLEPVSEDGSQFEWDGLRRRKTILGSTRSRAMTSPNPFTHTPPRTAATPHPPLGMSHFPTEEELAEHDRVTTPGALSSIVGTIRNRTRSVLLPGHPDYQPSQEPSTKVQSPMHPVQLTEIAVPSQHADEDGTYYSQGAGGYGLPTSKTEYEGSGASIPVSSGRRVQFGGESRQVSQGSTVSGSSGGLAPPTPPPHSARRQFSFQNVFRRNQQHNQQQQQQDGASDDHHRPISRPGILSSRGYSNPQVKGATEEERLGLVKGDSRSLPALPTYEDGYEDEDEDPYVDDKQSRYGRGITTSPPRRGSDEKGGVSTVVHEYDDGNDQHRWRSDSGSSHGASPPRPPPAPGGRRGPPPGNGDGAFI